MPLACLANGWKRSEGEAPDFTARVEEVAVDDRGDEVLSHIDGAEQALRAGRVIDAHEISKPPAAHSGHNRARDSAGKGWGWTRLGAGNPTQARPSEMVV